MIYKKLVKNISKSGVAINGKETDLSNYYNKQEIDTQQQAQDKKITSNKEYISYLDSQIQNIKLNELSRVLYSTNNGVLKKNNKDIGLIGLKHPQNENESGEYATDHITFSSENASLLIKSNGEFWNMSASGDLPIKYNENATNINFTNDNDIPNKRYVDDLVKNNIRFYKGQVLFFDTKQDFIDNLQTPLQLVENVEYEVIESGRYILSGDNGQVGGSNTITNDNLPYKEWSINIDTQWATGYGKNSPSVYGGTNSSVAQQSITTNYDLQTKSGVSGIKYTPKWNYGTQQQQDFKPKYKEVYAIKFLRNV